MAAQLALAGVLCLGGVFQSLALDPQKSVFQYNCRTWTRQNGLPADAVTSITQTKAGYIWLGTAQGLVSFDGIEFKPSDMSAAQSQIVLSLASSQKGGLWFGLKRGGVAHCDTAGISYPASEPRNCQDWTVGAVLETRNGDVWIGGETEVGRITGAGYQTILTNRLSGLRRYDVSAMLEDSKNRVWILGVHRGLYCWDKGSYKRFGETAFTDPEAHCLAEDAQGNIWVGTDVGALCYDQDMKRVPFPAPWWPVRAILKDRNGVMWFGTIGGGLFRYQNGNMNQFRKIDGLADDVVNCLAEDSDGTLWVGTLNGLTEISDVKIPTFGVNEGLTAQINVDLCVSKNGGIWVGTDKGVGYFDPKTVNYTVPLDVTNYISRIFEARNGDVYIIDGKRGIEIVSGGKSVAKFSSWIWPSAFAEDSVGVVVGTEGGVFRVATNGVKQYFPKGAPRPALDRVYNMVTDKHDAIWIACDNGICRVTNGTSTNRSFKIWTKKDGLPDSAMRSLCVDSDGTVWACSEKGLVRIQHDLARTITQSNGLYENLLYAVVSSDDGNLWMDSSRGFFKVRRQSLNDFLDGKTAQIQCAVFGGIDVVKTSERFQQQFIGCKTADGRLWFPTAQGIAMIDPSRMISASASPKVYVGSVRVSGEALDMRQSAAVIQPGRNDVEFDYVGLNYPAPMKVKYRYKLHGYDKDWVEAADRRVAFYTNLKPGAYRFEVEASTTTGVWSPAESGFAIEFLPHFYQTAWFMTLAIVAAAALVAAVIQQRLRHVHERQNRLQEARDLLEAKVEERTSELKKEIEERQRAQRDLIEASRQAGKAEVAASVLHNVGNVLNSVNISASVIRDHARNSKANGLSQLAQMLADNRANLAGFLSANGRADLVIKYLNKYVEELDSSQSVLLAEVQTLSRSIDHIKQIVAVQQSYARVAGVKELQSIPALVEDALRMQSSALERAEVKVLREFDPTPDILMDRHKALQILVNLIANARYALAESSANERVLTLRVRVNGHKTIQISVEDNGVGISSQNLTRIFTHGFTTRRDGHGFGLHSGFLAAKEMGGHLSVFSAGAGKGAAFTLEIPMEVAQQEAA